MNLRFPFFVAPLVRFSSVLRHCLEIESGKRKIRLTTPVDREIDVTRRSRSSTHDGITMKAREAVMLLLFSHVSHQMFFIYILILDLVLYV